MKVKTIFLAFVAGLGLAHSGFNTPLLLPLTSSLEVGEDVVNSILAYHLRNTSEVEYSDPSEPRFKKAKVTVKSVYVDLEEPLLASGPRGSRPPTVTINSYYNIELLVSWEEYGFEYFQPILIHRPLDATSLTITDENWIGFKTALFSEYSRLPKALRDALEKRYNRVIQTQPLNAVSSPNQGDPQILDYVAVFRTPVFSVTLSARNDYADIHITKEVKFIRESRIIAIPWLLNDKDDPNTTYPKIGRPFYFRAYAPFRFKILSAGLCEITYPGSPRRRDLATPAILGNAGFAQKLDLSLGWGWHTTIPSLDWTEPPYVLTVSTPLGHSVTADNLSACALVANKNNSTQKLVNYYRVHDFP